MADTSLAHPEPFHVNFGIRVLRSAAQINHGRERYRASTGERYPAIARTRKATQSGYPHPPAGGWTAQPSSPKTESVNNLAGQYT